MNSINNLDICFANLSDDIGNFDRVASYLDHTPHIGNLVWVKGSQKSDKEFEEIEKEVEKLAKEFKEVDHCLILYILAWYGFLYAKHIPFAKDKISATYQRWMKRKLEKVFGKDWKSHWAEIQKELKVRQKIVIFKTLFLTVPLIPHPARRNRDIRWQILFDLRYYFKKHTGKPRTGRIGKILFPEKTILAVYSEWGKRKGWFPEVDCDARLKSHTMFYEKNREKVIRSLKEKIPLYELRETDEITQQSISSPL